MKTLIIIALLCTAFGLRYEAVIKASVAGFGIIRLGRLAVGVWQVRPGRVYVRMEAIKCTI